MRSDDGNSNDLRSTRDIFLSHRSTDKEFVRSLAADIEGCFHNGRRLTVWLDEAEIRPGQSVPGLINHGLETSRFLALVMTPDYFTSESGWTDAEWHAALHSDPDNRRSRLVPLLVEDCPYIPYLLRHLRAIDFRGNRYGQGFNELVAVLRDEPMPRPTSYRGQLVEPGGRIDRASLVAERALPQADPDPVPERLYANLLPVEHLPKYVYVAPVDRSLCGVRKDGRLSFPSKQRVKDAVRTAQETAGSERVFTPAFRMIEGSIFTFHDLEDADGVMAGVIDDGAVETISTMELLRDEDERRLVVSLLNMAVARHAPGSGLVIDDTRTGRFYFPPKDGAENVYRWTPRKTRATRTVVKPCFKDSKVQFWRHLGAYLRIVFLANKLYLQVTPTWVITDDGRQLRTGPKVGRIVGRWTGPERNLHLLYHVRFWSAVLRRGRPGPTISIRAGDQSLELATVPAFVQQAYGISNDQKDLLGLLDQQAELIADHEDQMADMAAEIAMEESEEDEVEWEQIEEGED